MAGIRQVVEHREVLAHLVVRQGADRGLQRLQELDRFVAVVGLDGIEDAGERAELALDPQRLAYVHVARGAARINGQPLEVGDAAKLSGESRLVIDDGRDAEVIVFDLSR